jgi:hypothetical protein
MGMFDSFYAELTCPNCGCQAVVEASTKDLENALLAFTVGQAVESLTQADLHSIAGCRSTGRLSWCVSLLTSARWPCVGAALESVVAENLPGPIQWRRP